MKIFRQLLIRVFACGLCLWFVPGYLVAQNGSEGKSAAADPDSTEESSNEENEADVLPEEVSRKNFSELTRNSPFIRTLDISRSLVLTGMARIEGETVATMYDLETRKSYTLSQGAVSDEGWQLVEVVGDPSDLESLTAKVKVGTAGVVSVRYEKSPVRVAGGNGVAVSNRIGNGTPGGGTGPHGGPDPRVLTPDQLADARNGARNIRGGFQADGYPDRATIPSEVVNKLSRLSVDQRESINIKMFEYRNRGLGMPERQRIYNGLLDRALERR